LPLQDLIQFLSCSAHSRTQIYITDYVRYIYCRSQSIT